MEPSTLTRIAEISNIIIAVCTVIGVLIGFIHIKTPDTSKCLQIDLVGSVGTRNHTLSVPGP